MLLLRVVAVTVIYLVTRPYLECYREVKYTFQVTLILLSVSLSLLVSLLGLIGLSHS